MTEASSGQVRTSSCIWASCVTLHGETYVSALSNEPAEELVYDTEMISTVDVMYIARGPLGVKKVVFACSKETLQIESRPRDWWQTLPLGKGCRLRFDFDGLKIRNLRTDQHGNFQLPLWSAPFYRPGLMRYPLYPSSGPARYNRLTINDPGTTGYSVAWNPARRNIVDLIVVTTAGRVHVLGHHPTPGQAYAYSRVAKLRRQRDYLFIDDSAGIRELALTPAPEEANETRHLRKPAPESCYPAITSVESYFYTFAPHANLDLIKMCSFGGVVTGLLFQYHDSSRARMGQVRLDWLGPEQQVPREATVRFTMSRTADQCPYVGSVLVYVAPSARNLLPSKSDLDFEVTCCGNLE
ncbi:hypothetical protein MAJ_02752, partial [Metarhizium majus ARSEF 297]